MSPPLLPQDITMTSETEESVLDLTASIARITCDLGLSDPGGPPGCRVSINGEQATTVRSADLRALLAALSRAPEALELGSSTRMTSPASRSQTPLSAGWQDISSAPTMEAVLVYGGEVKYPVVASWTGLNDEPWTLDALGNVHDEIDWPTHWMPLPEPPAENGLSGAQRSELTRLAQDGPLSPPSTGGAIKRTMTLNLTDEEMAALEALAKAKDMEPPTIFRHALRLYQVSHDEAVNGPIPRGPLGSPSPEMGEISRNDLIELIETNVVADWGVDSIGRTGAFTKRGSIERAADAIDAKLKENGLSREELGGLAQSQPGSDAQERSPVPPLSDGGRG